MAKREKKPKVAKPPKPLNPCLNATIDTTQVPTHHYGIKLPFSPSNAQMLRYAKHHKHKVVLNRKADPPAPTFDEDALRKLQGWYPNDPLYPLIAQYRETEKCLGTYVRGMEPDADGRVRGEYNHRAKTLRLAMRSPSLQVIPKDDGSGSVYARVKEFFVAAPGHGFTEIDYASIEAVLVGYLANDRELIRLAGDRVKDVHGFIATTALGKAPDLTWSDDDLRGYLKEFRKENRTWDVNGRPMTYDALRQGCKQSLYLSMYLGTPSRMVQAAPNIFPTRQVAKYFQELFFTTFPKVPKWQWATCEQAEQLGYVLTPDGFRQHFSDVFVYTWSGTEWTREYGPAAKEAVAGAPQHLGIIFSAVAIAALRREYPEIHEGLRLSIHDSLLTEFPLEKREAYAYTIQQVMERPLPCLPLPAEWGMGSHLAIATEAKFSYDDGHGIHRWSSLS